MLKHVIVLIAVALFAISCQKDDPVGPIPVKEFTFIADIEVGTQPDAIFYDPSTELFHVICRGFDYDYNFQKDAGDISPSWWVIDKNDMNNPVQMLEFEFNSVFFGTPPRLAFDPDGRQLFISQNGKISRYDIDNFTLIEEIGDYFAIALSVKGDYLFISQNPIEDEKGEVVVYDLNTKEELSKKKCGVLTKQTLVYEMDGKQMLAVVSEGKQETDAMLHFFEFKDSKLELYKEFTELGKWGNSIVKKDNLLAYILNGTHQVYIFNLTDLSIKSTFETGTEGYNGPREAVFYGSNELIVSTFDNDLRIFDINSGSMKKEISLDAFAEGLSLVQDKLLLVCRNLNTDYSPNNIVSVFEAK